jgi:hypothetical protein
MSATVMVQSNGHGVIERQLWCHRVTISVLQWCCSDVIMVLQWCSHRWVQGLDERNTLWADISCNNLIDVLMVFKWCSNELSYMLGSRR